MLIICEFENCDYKLYRAYNYLELHSEGHFNMYEHVKL